MMDGEGEGGGVGRCMIVEALSPVLYKPDLSLSPLCTPSFLHVPALPYNLTSLALHRRHFKSQL